MNVTISQVDAKTLVDLAARQNGHAHSLGVMEFEFLRARAMLLDVASQPNLESLGALQWEHDKQQMFWFSKIKETEQMQRAAGERALVNAGVDAKKGDYKIENGTNIVYQLVHGRWVVVERRGY